MQQVQQQVQQKQQELQERPDSAPPEELLRDTELSDDNNKDIEEEEAMIENMASRLEAMQVRIESFDELDSLGIFGRVHAGRVPLLRFDCPSSACSYMYRCKICGEPSCPFLLHRPQKI